MDIKGLVEKVVSEMDYPDKVYWLFRSLNFSEIFGDKGGFDIVIGNPPYVRQEKISPPNKLLKSIQVSSIFSECGINPARPVREQKPNPLPDRKALDDIVFDILGLTEDERSEVYWAVCELVKNRLDKARSV